jgi:branched-chain amino acid aminotransferase
VTRGVEGSGRPTVVVFCQPIPFKTFARQYLDGAHVVTPSTRQLDSQMVDPKLKTTSRIHQHLAEQEAKLVDPQAYALVLDRAGNVCEAFPGHNFWVVDGSTVVSPRGQAILRGITRDTLVEVAQKIGVPVKEADIQLYDVVNAHEAFLSGTSRCIVPVTRVNGIPLGDGAPGPVVRELTKAWVDCFGFDFVQQALSHLEERA